ncbi:hypothetical protein Pelo_4310 [Pelomyxa schiedti]|nr:hypothetical protein Pelo_4310 [Pelomyxa schiedti]
MPTNTAPRTVLAYFLHSRDSTPSPAIHVMLKCQFPKTRDPIATTVTSAETNPHFGSCSLIVNSNTAALHAQQCPTTTTSQWRNQGTLATTTNDPTCDCASQQRQQQPHRTTPRRIITTTFITTTSSQIHFCLILYVPPELPKNGFAELAMSLPELQIFPAQVKDKKTPLNHKTQKNQNNQHRQRLLPRPETNAYDDCY